MQGCAAMVANIRLNGIFDAALRTVDYIIVVGCISIHGQIHTLISRASTCLGQAQVANLKL